MSPVRQIKEGLPVHADVEDVGISGERANILVICTDQLRADALGVHGHPIIQTPQIDQLAMSGIRFEHAMSECPVCCPARRILMTGLDPYGIHMNINRDLQPFPEGPKLAELLSGAGYQTHGVGKMHTWPPRSRMGFDDIEINEEGRTAGHPIPDDYQQFLQEEGLGPIAHAHGLGNNQVGYRPSPVPEYATSTGWTADRAMRFLRRRDPERPFFLYVSFDKPHPPATPPAEYYDLYRDLEFPKPVEGDWCEHKPLARKAKMQRAHNWELFSGREDVNQQWQRGYAAMITHIDSRIGQILGTLREQGLDKNTWILFTSDHGDHSGDHGMVAKGDFLAGSCRIPLLLVPPDTALSALDSSRISQASMAPAGLADLLPTLCEISGASCPEQVVGQSLVPFLREEAPNFREYSFGNVTSHYSAQSQSHRYCWCSDTGYEYFFDLAADPKNVKDLSDTPELQELKQAHRAALMAWMEANADPCLADGKLQTMEVKSNEDHLGMRVSHWNNRGWRG